MHFINDDYLGCIIINNTIKNEKYTQYCEIN